MKLKHQRIIHLFNFVYVIHPLAIYITGPVIAHAVDLSYCRCKFLTVLVFLVIRINKTIAVTFSF